MIRSFRKPGLYSSLNILLAIVLGISLFLAGVSPSARAQDDNPLDKETQYFHTEKVMTLPDGRMIYKAKVAGPSSRPEGFDNQPVNLSDPAVQEAAVVLMDVPAFDWVFGCSAVSGAMIAGYYDRNGLPNIYTGPSNGGVIPLTSSMWGTWVDSEPEIYPRNPLIASQNGLDGRAIKGSIDDYWIKYGSESSDPYITGAWTQHTWGTAVGDYMKTSQSAYGNSDGESTFYYYTDGYPLTCDESDTYGLTEDGALGYGQFYPARGYTVGSCYTQLTDNLGLDYGFTYNQYKQQINNGRPVMIHVEGHTMVGVGYSTTSNTIYLHDTWDYGTWSMPWGGSYYGMDMWGVSIVNPIAGNDSISSPRDLEGVPSEYYQTTTGAGHSGNEPSFAACGQATPSASVWYRALPPVNGEASIDTFGSSYNTMLGIWKGSPGSLQLVGCNDNAKGTLQSQLSLSFTAGQTYYIGIAQKGAETGGNLALHVTSFNDVPGSHPLWRYVEGFFARGITTGCAVNPLKYCPDRGVTRAEMAVFLMRSIHAEDATPYVPEDIEPDIFIDVPVAGKEFMEPWIEQFYTLGITTGCGGTFGVDLRYCPERGVTRAEMAVFMLRAKHGSAYVPADLPDIFVDVPAPGKDWMEPWIEQFYAEGYTTGCGGTPGVDLRYCPERGANRAEMATFIDRIFEFDPLPPLP